eukprot:gene2681-2930_t
MTSKPLLLFLLLFVSWTISSYSWRPHYGVQVGRRSRFNTALSVLKLSHVELEEALQNNDYELAYQILKRNPMLQVKKDDVQALLNNIEKCEKPAETKEKYQKQLTDISVFLFRRLERQNVLRGFNCVHEDYPFQNTDITPAKLEQLTGLSISALTPKTRVTNWRLAGIALCVAEYFLGRELGIDPLVTIIPGTFLLFGLDQLIFRGAYFESVYRALAPEYKKKVINHEAGHFLIAYLLGLPIRAVATSAFDALKYPEIKGQAGTIFFDAKMAEEIASGKLTRKSLDRLSVVLMAGIAAEAAIFGNSEGGIADEQALISALTSVSPPWNILRIQSQARWGVLQAISLIQEHRAAFDALAKALEEGKGVGDAVRAIEDNLPKELPAYLRHLERQEERKIEEHNQLLRFVQKMTWKVGGVENVPLFETENKEEGMVFDNPFVEPTADAPSRKEVAESFSRKLEMLEKAVSKGDINVNEAKDGVWLNGLKSLRPQEDSTGTAALPKPVENYEENIRKLAIQDGLLSSANSTSRSFRVEDFLHSHAGYQMKQIELDEQFQRNKIAELDAKLIEARKGLAGWDVRLTSSINLH